MNRNKITILVIEDEPDLLEEISSMLQYENYGVITASDGDTGIRLAMEHKPDMILCDIVMRGTDGFAVLKKLREKPEFGLTPFIFITALAEWHSLRQGMEAGADDYIVKPFTRMTLLNALTTRLAKAKDNQKQIKQFKNNIIYSVPHELQTPLNVIIGYCKMMKEEPDNLTREEITEMCSDIHDSAVRLAEVVRKFLMLTDVELNKDRKTFSRVNINTKTVSKLAGQIADKYQRNSDLVLEIADFELDSVKEWFLFALGELIDNAFKFSVPGAIVTVKSFRDDKNITLTISDHGRGFPPDSVEKINAFVQFDRKTKEQQGTGLGLFIAKQIFLLHGGEMFINSTVNNGSDIIVKFPE